MAAKEPDGIVISGDTICQGSHREYSLSFFPRRGRALKRQGQGGSGDKATKHYKDRKQENEYTPRFVHSHSSVNDEARHE